MSVTHPRGFSRQFWKVARGGWKLFSSRAGADSDKSSLVRRVLVSQMAKAKRHGGWFRLSTLERGILSLALKTNATFESLALNRALVSILCRLKELCAPFREQIMRGSAIALAFSEAATSWGNPNARSWREDRSYHLFLGLLFSGAGNNR